MTFEEDNQKFIMQTLKDWKRRALEAERKLKGVMKIIEPVLLAHTEEVNGESIETTAKRMLQNEIDLIKQLFDGDTK